MSPRSIRRAAERQARKEQNRDRQEAASSISPAQLTANRANAQLSTGPTSETGKRTSSLNAGVDEAAVLSVPKTQTVTGLTGRTVLLPSDDADVYRRHIAAYEAEYKPAGLRECELVQSLADTQWRLNRIPGLESAIYALGHTEFKGVVEDEQIELHTHLKYESSLRNLQLQESRLLRRYQKEMAELRALQKERQTHTHAEAELDEAAFLSEPKTQRMASNFQTEVAQIQSAASRLIGTIGSSPDPLPSPHIDSFALPSSPYGNFSAPANVD